jgi:hypothetical protein
VVEEAGATLWSKEIDNDETAILTSPGGILNLADEVHRAVDISGTPPAPLPVLPTAHGRQAVYVPGRTVDMSAQTSIIREGPEWDFHLKKRGEGRKHVRAVTVLADRRAGVLWVFLRGNRVFTPTSPVAQTVCLHH